MAQIAQVDPRAMRRQLAWIILPVNLLGAVVVFTYFRFVDYATVEIAHVPLAGEVAYLVIGLAALIAAGVVLGVRWAAPLADIATPGSGGDAARRRAAQMPWAVAAITAIGWCLAGIIWGILWPLLFGTFVPFRSARTMLGIVVVTGVPAIAAVFFIAEHRWRRLLPELFPEGGLTGIAGMPRLSVRARLLAIFFLVSEIPVFVLGMAAYRGASTALTGGPDADSVMLRMLAIVAFLVLTTIVMSAGLAFFVARSVAEPLGRLEQAMADVERGRFDVRCPVVSNDEIGRLTEGFNHMVRGRGERAFLRETFGKYVSAEIRDEILAGRVTLEGQLREATILFADIRDFTPWVEASDPREVVRDLNAYFTEMETAIRSHGGLVLQYIGDEIEAVFGAPVDKPNHAEAAVRAALDMRARLAVWNTARQRAGRPPLRNGIGVHTGTVLAGSIGSADRLSYALVGDPVNLASRLQNLTKELPADILVSGTTRANLEGDLPLVPLPAVKVKGRMAEVEVYALG